MLRRPSENEEPTTVCTSVVSVVRRDSTSPVCVLSKNSGLCLQHVGVDRAAQVGGDALAQPADRGRSGRPRTAQRHRHAEQLEEVAAQRHQPLAVAGFDQPLVDQAAQRDREDQGGRGRQDEEQGGQRDAAAVGAQEGQQPGQRLGVALGGRCVGHAESVLLAYTKVDLTVIV
jgi:hypothetical protein